MQRPQEIKSDQMFAARIWEAETTMPRVFQAASLYWTPDFTSYLKFWESCSEIWGLFDVETNKLLAAVYLFTPEPKTLEVHLSVVGCPSSEDLTYFFRWLRKKKQNENSWNIRAWVLSANMSLRRIMEAAGFYQSELTLEAGEYRGKVLKWLLFNAKAYEHPV